MDWITARWERLNNRDRFIIAFLLEIATALVFTNSWLAYLLYF